MHRFRVLLASLLLAGLSACESPDPEVAASGPRKWSDSDPSELARDVAAVDAAALRGDKAAVRANMERAQDNFRRSMKLPDATKPIDHELARVAAKRVRGVRSVVWLDRENLFAIVDKNEQKTQETIDAICLELDPLGDTLAVVVNLQSGAATSGDDLEVLSRNCQLEPGDRAMLQQKRQVDVISPEIRAQQKANNGR